MQLRPRLQQQGACGKVEVSPVHLKQLVAAAAGALSHVDSMQLRPQPWPRLQVQVQLASPASPAAGVWVQLQS
jgi:hypothetical protein